MWRLGGKQRRAKARKRQADLRAAGRVEASRSAERELTALLAAGAGSASAADVLRAAELAVRAGPDRYLDGFLDWAARAECSDRELARAIAEGTGHAAQRARSGIMSRAIELLWRLGRRGASLRLAEACVCPVEGMRSVELDLPDATVYEMAAETDDAWVRELLPEFQRDALMDGPFTAPEVDAWASQWARWGRCEPAGVLAASDGETGSAAVAELDPPAFRAAGDADVSAYRGGVRAAPGHIAAGLDMRRPWVSAEIERALAEIPRCVILGLEGQGKSTAMYRWAYDHRDEFRVLELRRADTTELADAAAAAIDDAMRSADTPILLLVDDLYGPRFTEAPRLFDRLGEPTGLYVLATSHVDAWYPAWGPSVPVARVVLTLRGDEAEAIWDHMAGQGEAARMTWDRALTRSRAAQGSYVLGTFLHCMRHGVGRRKWLEQRTDAFAWRDEGPLALDVLMCVCEMDVRMCSIGRDSLARLTGAPPEQLESALALLVAEQLITQDANGQYRGFHPLFSEVMPGRATGGELRRQRELELVRGLTPADLVSALPSLLGAAEEPIADLAAEAAGRLGCDVPVAAMPGLLRAVFVAGEVGFAERCHAAAGDLSESTGIAWVLPEYRLPSGCHDETPGTPLDDEEAKSVAQSLPLRSPDTHPLLALVTHLDAERLAGSLRGCGLETLAGILDWIGHADAQVGLRLWRHMAGAGAMPSPEGAADAAVCGLISALQRIDRLEAASAVDAFECHGALERSLIARAPRIDSIRCLGSGLYRADYRMLGGTCPSELGLNATALPHELAAEVFGVLPNAEEVDVCAVDELGIGPESLGDEARVRVRREDVAAVFPESQSRHEVWGEAFRRRYRAATWSACLRSLADTRVCALDFARAAAVGLSTLAESGDESACEAVVATTGRATTALCSQWQSMPFPPGDQLLCTLGGASDDMLPMHQYFALLGQSLEAFLIGLGPPYEEEEPPAPPGVLACDMILAWRNFMELLSATGPGGDPHPELGDCEDRILWVYWSTLRELADGPRGLLSRVPRRGARLLKQAAGLLRQIDGTRESRSLRTHAEALAREAQAAVPRSAACRDLVAALTDGEGSPADTASTALAICERLTACGSLGLAAEDLLAERLQALEASIGEAIRDEADCEGLVRSVSAAARSPDDPRCAGIEIAIGVTPHRGRDIRPFAEVVGEVTESFCSESDIDLVMVVDTGAGISHLPGIRLSVGSSASPDSRPKAPKRFYADRRFARRHGWRLTRTAELSAIARSTIEILIVGLRWGMLVAFGSRVDRPERVPWAARALVEGREAIADCRDILARDVARLRALDLPEELAERAEGWFRELEAHFAELIELAIDGQPPAAALREWLASEHGLPLPDGSRPTHPLRESLGDLLDAVGASS